VTTEQELKLAVLASVVVVVDAGNDVDDAEALVVGVALVDVGDEEGDELHAARRTTVGTATTIPKRP
jgi:hypothetical protein